MTDLERYRDKRAEWFSWYSVDSGDVNGIERQLHLMLLSEMTSRLLIEEQQRLRADERSPIITFALESGYLSTQVLAIRKLLDTDNNVFSLGRVLQELKRHRSLLTRENFVTFDETPYRAEPVFPPGGFQALDSPFYTWSRSEERHSTFDKLAKVSSPNRTPSDILHTSVLERVEDWLFNEPAKKARKISNKLLAHAATPRSRGDFAYSGIAFSEVEEAQRSLVRVAKSIYDVILASGVFSEVVPSLPLGFFGQVWDLDKLTLKKEVQRRDERWSELRTERNSWVANLRHDLLIG